MIGLAAWHCVYSTLGEDPLRKEYSRNSEYGLDTLSDMSIDRSRSRSIELP